MTLQVLTRVLRWRLLALKLKLEEGEMALEVVAVQLLLVVVLGLLLQEVVVVGLQVQVFHKVLPQLWERMKRRLQRFPSPLVASAIKSQGMFRKKGVSLLTSPIHAFLDHRCTSQPCTPLLQIPCAPSEASRKWPTPICSPHTYSPHTALHTSFIFSR